MSKAGQLSLKQRYLLESLLNEGSKLCTIASALDRDPRGIAYEIKSHRQLFVRKNQRNQCGIQDKCQKVRLCDQCDSGLCKYCSYLHCDSLCPDFCETPHCKSISRFLSILLWRTQKWAERKMRKESWAFQGDDRQGVEIWIISNRRRSLEFHCMSTIIRGKVWTIIHRFPVPCRCYIKKCLNWITFTHSQQVKLLSNTWINNKTPSRLLHLENGNFKTNKKIFVLKPSFHALKESLFFDIIIPFSVYFGYRSSEKTFKIAF